MCVNDIKVGVAGVKYHEKGKAPAIVLQDKESGLGFGILINKMAAHETLAVLEPRHKTHTRPFSPDFVLAIAKAAGVRFSRVIIDRFNTDGSFGATVVICGANGEEIGRVDARPSDAVPVAILADARITVTPEVAANVPFSDPGRFPYREIRHEDLE